MWEKRQILSDAVKQNVGTTPRPGISAAKPTSTDTTRICILTGQTPTTDTSADAPSTIQKIKICISYWNSPILTKIPSQRKALTPFRKPWNPITITATVWTACAWAYSLCMTTTMIRQSWRGTIDKAASRKVGDQENIEFRGHHN